MGGGGSKTILIQGEFRHYLRKEDDSLNNNLSKWNLRNRRSQLRVPNSLILCAKVKAIRNTVLYTTIAKSTVDMGLKSFPIW